MATSTRKPPIPNNLNRRPQAPAPSSRSSPSVSTLNAAADAAAAVTPERRSGIARRNTIREGGHARTSSMSSPLSARAAAKARPVTSGGDEELETAAMLEDLRNRLARSESAAEAAAVEYAKQIKALQARLEESLSEQAKMEEASHQKDETIERLEVQVKDLTRTKREQENIYEAERIATQQEKEELLNREEELNTIIQRLKATLAARDSRSPGGRRNSSDSAPSDEPQGFAPAAHSSIPSQSDMVAQKEKVIESLRHELAEAQIRLAEADQMEGARLQQLEAQLLEVRMTNARLMEDNESFQMLLSSAALNGDFPRTDFMSSAFSDTATEAEQSRPASRSGSVTGLGLNLAAELDDADEKEENEKIRKLELEIKTLKDTNKGMSLYINNIIERILQHKDSEAILDKTAQPKAEKPLPPAPQPAPSETGVNILGFQRTKSMASRRLADGTPGSPLQRSPSLRSSPRPSHKRTQSDASYTTTRSSIYGNDGFITPRANTFFGGDRYTRSSRPRDSTASVDSGVSDTNTSSDSDRYSLRSPTSSTIGPITGNKLRPLQLVQKNVNSGMMSPPLNGRKISGDYMDDADARTERRTSKRTSWMGWFSKTSGPGREENEATKVGKEDVVFEGKDVE